MGQATEDKEKNDNNDNLPSPPPTRPKGLFAKFFYDVNPINVQEWRNGNLVVKIVLILRSPFMLLLQLFVPVVNEMAEKRGWSKLLNCFQVCLTPIVALCILGREFLFRNFLRLFTRNHSSLLLEE